MKVKELVEQLLTLDQEKRIGVLVEGCLESRILDLKILLSNVDSENKITRFENKSTFSVYEISEK